VVPKCLLETSVGDTLWISVLRECDYGGRGVRVPARRWGFDKDESVSRPEVFDDARWVTAFGYEGRLFLGVNPHVHVGRIAVWSDALGLATRISFGDVIEASVEARAWLDGYLAGSEPSPAFMFGREIHSAPDDDPRWVRWQAAVAEYRRTGTWLGGSWEDVTPIEAGAQLPVPASTRRGDEVWEWDGEPWQRAALQPPWAGTLPDASSCQSRQHHSMAMIDPRHLQCEDCGYTHEIEPD
jgi:hypothetical protein